MNIVRYDQVGTVQIRLVRRPTNTAAGVDNFHFYAEGVPGSFPCSLVRFFGTDEGMAHERYNLALVEAEAIADQL